MKIFLFVGILVDLAAIYFEIFPNLDNSTQDLGEAIKMTQTILHSERPEGAKTPEFHDLSSKEQTTLIISLVFLVYINLVTQMIHLLIFIASVAIYEIVNETKRNVEMLTQSKVINFRLWIYILIL